MGLLDNSSLTVDAVLTKKGREKLSQNQFNVKKFAIGDDEVDYTLWNTAHPSGSAYYGKVIENMPVNEATMYTTIQNKLKRRTTDIIQTVIAAGGASAGTALQITYTEDKQQSEFDYNIYMFTLTSTTTEDFNIVLEIPSDVTTTNDDILSSHVFLLSSPYGDQFGSRNITTQEAFLRSGVVTNVNKTLRNDDGLKTLPRQTAVANAGSPNMVLVVFGKDLINQYRAKSFSSNFASVTVTGRTSGAVSTFPLQFTFNTA